MEYYIYFIELEDGRKIKVTSDLPDGLVQYNKIVAYIRSIENA